MTKKNTKNAAKATKKDTKRAKSGHYTPPNGEKYLPPSFREPIRQTDRKKGIPDD